MTQRILVLLSERGYWGEELIGPLESILRDATAPNGEYVGNVSRVRSVIVDYPLITSRSTPDSYLCGEKMVEVLEQGPTRWGW